MAAHMRSHGVDVPLPVVGEFNPPNRLLCGPGPGNAHPRVLAKMGLPQVGHLDPYFLELMEEIKALLRYTFQTKNDFTIPVSGTGSAAMEACVCNMLEPGDTFLVGVNGYFGNRLCDMASRYGAKVCPAEHPAGGERKGRGGGMCVGGIYALHCPATRGGESPGRVARAQGAVAALQTCSLRGMLTGGRRARDKGGTYSVRVAC